MKYLSDKFRSFVLNITSKTNKNHFQDKTFNKKSLAIKIMAVALLATGAVSVLSLTDTHESKAWPETYTYSMYPTCEYKPSSGLTGYDAACMKGSIEILVYKYYKSALNREPDESGFGYWTKGILNKTAAESQLADAVANEYVSNSIAKISDGDYVKMAYTAILGREADDGGLTHWVNQLKSGVSRANFIKSLASTTEATNKGLTLAQAQSKMSNSINYVVGSNFVVRLIQTSNDPSLNPVSYMTKWSPDDPNIAHYRDKIQNGQMTYGSVLKYFIHNKGTGAGGSDFNNFKTYMNANHTPSTSDFTPPRPAEGVSDNANARFVCGPPFPAIEPKANGNMGGPDYEHNVQCVGAIQWILKNKAGQSGVTVTGFYFAKDKVMVAAVKNIQRYFGMPVTGYLTSGQVETILKAMGGDNVDTTTPWTTPRFHLHDMNDCINGDAAACEKYQQETGIDVSQYVQDIVESNGNNSGPATGTYPPSSSGGSGNSNGGGNNNSSNNSGNGSSNSGGNSSSSTPSNTDALPSGGGGDHMRDMNACSSGDVAACKRYLQEEPNISPAVREMIEQIINRGGTSSGGDTKNNSSNDTKEKSNSGNSTENTKPITQKDFDMCIKEGDATACTNLQNAMKANTTSDDYVREYMLEAAENAKKNNSRNASGGSSSSSDTKTTKGTAANAKQDAHNEPIQMNVKNAAQPYTAINYTFIGSGMTSSDTEDSQRFYDIVEKTIDNLSTLDTFKDYIKSGKFAFNTIITNKDFGCSSSSAQTACDENELLDFIATKNIPADSKIIVITNDSSKGWAALGDSQKNSVGSRGAIGIRAYSSTKDVSWGIVHKIGHNLGLVDEYVLGSSASTALTSLFNNALLSPNTPFHQCLAVEPPENWKKTDGPWSKFSGVNIDKWYSGCGISELYKSSANSLMGDFTGPNGHTLSPASSVVLKDNIDYVLSSM